MIRDNLKRVDAAIAAACRRAGRCVDEVVLVGVTKYSDAAAMNEALAAGLKHVAENRVQAAQEKFKAIDPALGAVTRHLIGHLQTNKAKEAVQLFDLIQSVDSVKLADEINKRAMAMGKCQDILIQLDIAEEEQKFGLPLEDLDAMLAHLKNLHQVRVLGLMTMAPLTEDKEEIRQVFRACREIFEHLKKTVPASSKFEMKYLSMGMSGDMDIAIEEGATMIRVGSAIFKL